MFGRSAAKAMKAVSATLLVSAGIAGATPAVAAGSPVAITVEIEMTPKMAAEMARRKEATTVVAFYYGIPSKAFAKKANAERQIDLGKAEITVDGSVRRVTLDGKAVKQDRFAWLDGEPKVVVNIFSARRSSPDNILSCHLYDGALAVAAAAPVHIRCMTSDEWFREATGQAPAGGAAKP